MHSSRMRTVLCSGHLGRGEGGSECLPKEVSAQGCPPSGVCPEGVTVHGVSA